MATVRDRMVKQQEHLRKMQKSLAEDQQRLGERQSQLDENQRLLDKEKQHLAQENARLQNHLKTLAANKEKIERDLQRHVEELDQMVVNRELQEFKNTTLARFNVRTDAVGILIEDACDRIAGLERYVDDGSGGHVEKATPEMCRTAAHRFAVSIFSAIFPSSRKVKDYSFSLLWEWERRIVTGEYDWSKSDDTVFSEDPDEEDDKDMERDEELNNGNP